MKVTIFTSNQPRHLNFARLLGSVADEVFCVSETRTLFAGEIPDLHLGSKVMVEYFSKVISSEKNIFGEVDLLPENVRVLPLRLIWPCN